MCWIEKNHIWLSTCGNIKKVVGMDATHIFNDAGTE